jgi:hypothetical protein
VIDPPTGEFLAMDELFEDACVTPAELRRVARQQPAVVELHLLPAARPFRYMGRRPRTFLGLGLSRQVLLQELDELGTERLNVCVKSELHTSNISST